MTKVYMLNRLGKSIDVSVNGTTITLPLGDDQFLIPVYKDEVVAKKQGLKSGCGYTEIEVEFEN